MKGLKTKSVLKRGILAFVCFMFTLGLMVNTGASETRGVSETEIRIGVVPDLDGAQKTIVPLI